MESLGREPILEQALHVVSWHVKWIQAEGTYQICKSINEVVNLPQIQFTVLLH